MKNLIRKVVNKILLPHSNLSYSQSGEDLIVAYLLHKLNIKSPYYLDIGTNRPKLINNTYYFYIRGFTGVCVEANPKLAAEIKRSRPKDTVLEKGIGISEQADMDFYVFSGKYDGLSTFSQAEAEHWSKTGSKEHGKIPVEKVIKIPLISINTVIEKYCSHLPDFVSLDVEGWDLAILQSMNFEAYRPHIFCVETLLYDSNQNESKNEELIRFMKSKGYAVYADTNINTIFVNEHH